MCKEEESMYCWFCESHLILQQRVAYPALPNITEQRYSLNKKPRSGLAVRVHRLQYKICREFPTASNERTTKA